MFESFGGVDGGGPVRPPVPPEVAAEAERRLRRGVGAAAGAEAIGALAEVDAGALDGLRRDGSAGGVGALLPLARRAAGAGGGRGGRGPPGGAATTSPGSGSGSRCAARAGRRRRTWTSPGTCAGGCRRPGRRWSAGTCPMSSRIASQSSLIDGVVVGEVPTVLDDLAELVVQRLDRVGGVDDLPDLGRERQERDEPLPGASARPRPRRGSCRPSVASRRARAARSPAASTVGAV